MAKIYCITNVSARDTDVAVPSSQGRPSPQGGKLLTDSNIRALLKVVDEQMDSVSREQRERLEAIGDELEDVKRKLGRVWHLIEMANNVEMTGASDRIREHRERNH